MIFLRPWERHPPRPKQDQNMATARKSRICSSMIRLGPRRTGTLTHHFAAANKEAAAEAEAAWIAFFVMEHDLGGGGGGAARPRDQNVRSELKWSGLCLQISFSGERGRAREGSKCSCAAGECERLAGRPPICYASRGVCMCACSKLVVRALLTFQIMYFDLNPHP